MHRDLKPQNILLDSDLNIKFVRRYLFPYDAFRLILVMPKKRVKNLLRKKKKLLSTRKLQA